MRGRFAPSPSGRMHLGNVYSALLSYLSAHKKGGEWILRVEDLDRQRCKKCGRFTGFGFQTAETNQRVDPNDEYAALGKAIESCHLTEKGLAEIP